MYQAHEAGIVSLPARQFDSWQGVRAMAPVIFVALAYYAGCMAGFALRFPASGISFFWPPTAILTASLLLVRPTAWPGLLLGALAAHAVAHVGDGVPPAAWIIQFTGNGVQAVLAALCANRRSQIEQLFADVRSALIFIVGACIGAPAVASFIPAAVYVHLGWAGDFWGAWQARAITNAVASMTLIPALFVAGRFLLSANRKLPARWMEFVLLTLCILSVHLVTTFLAPAGVLGLAVALYAPLPFLLWAVVRCGSAGLSFALLSATLLTVVTASNGQGPFVAQLSADTVLGVHIFLGASAALMLLIAGLLNQQRAERAKLIEVGHQNSAIMARMQETQQRYELATAAGGVGVWEWNLRSGDLHIEGTLKALLGYRNEDVQDRLDDWMRLVAPPDRRRVRARLDAFASGVMSNFEAEFRVLHRDGSQRWIASKGAVTDRVDGAPARATGTYTDITQRKQSARALRDATDALARAWRISAIAEVSASLAHEIKQPLTAIVTNVTACLRGIENGTMDGELTEALNDVLQEGRRASHIVERTRDMFMNRPSESASVDMNEVVHEILEVVQPRLRELQIALNLRLHASLPSVIADVVQIRQVILNLVVNAVDAMQDASNERVLTISTRYCRDIVILNVRDTGRGFSRQERRRLFEPFYTTKTGGLGMGLAISRSIMRSHQGSLHALTNVAAGATFRLKLPAADHQPRASQPQGSTQRVLLVDDHEGIRKSLVRLLRVSGREVVEASNGADALVVAERFKPEAAVVDVSLGDMSGLELARRLRENNTDLRLFALTAYRDDDLRKACLAAGFDAYLVKPEGISRIQKMLG